MQILLCAGPVWKCKGQMSVQGKPYCYVCHVPHAYLGAGSDRNSSKKGRDREGRFWTVLLRLLRHLAVLETAAKRQLFCDVISLGLNICQILDPPKAFHDKSAIFYAYQYFQICTSKTTVLTLTALWLLHVDNVIETLRICTPMWRKCSELLLFGPTIFSHYYFEYS